MIKGSNNLHLQDRKSAGAVSACASGGERQEEGQAGPLGLHGVP